MGGRDYTRDTVRLDQWLHAARFYKTRALAAAAIKAHRVVVNGARVKPARPVVVGDRLEVVRGQERWEISVTVLSRRRGPAKVAQGLYQESEASALARQRLAEDRRGRTAAAPHPGRRPDKRSRRHLIRFLKGGADSE